jgi:hypothetical protein
MKYLRKYGLFESNTDIDSICKKYGIKNYTINGDGTVDVDGNVDLAYGKFSKLPLKFGRVTGRFSCHNIKLTTLDGCPKEVGGSFLCNDNQLTTLEGCPKEVGGSFYCSNNQLTSLEGCPREVGGYFDCGNNQLTTLEGCPGVVGGNFDCCLNQLTTLEGGPREVGGGFLCQNNKLATLLGCPKKIGGNFYCQYNQLTIINDELEFVEYFDISYNPISEVYKLFPDFESFKYSLDYNYFRSPNQIVKHRFEEACREAGITVPEKIKGYQYI